MTTLKPRYTQLPVNWGHLAKLNLISFWKVFLISIIVHFIRVVYLIVEGRAITGNGVERKGGMACNKDPGLDTNQGCCGSRLALNL